MMRAPLLTEFVLLGAIPASAAEEPSGCDKFKWPIERERAALRQTGSRLGPPTV
jgi:hypothetical protein